MKTLEVQWGTPEWLLKNTNVEEGEVIPLKHWW
jgi:hypothetical protein